MKISEKPTSWLLVKAGSNNEFSPVNSCLVEVSKEDLEKWSNRTMDCIHDGNTDEDYYATEYHFYGCTFLKLDMNDEDELEGDLEGSDSFWVEEPLVAEITKYSLDEKVIACSMTVNKYGNIYIHGVGKYSGDNYETEELDIDLNI